MLREDLSAVWRMDLAQVRVNVGIDNAKVHRCEMHSASTRGWTGSPAEV